MSANEFFPEKNKLTLREINYIKSVLEYLLLLELNKIIQDGDILLMQGAGDVGKLTEKLVTKLKTSLEEIKV